MKKGITLVAVLVGVLAVTSGAFAAKQYLITSSSQIKDGTVRLSDLAPGARKALYSAKGTKGDTGAAGPRGQDGAAGPPGHRGGGAVDDHGRSAAGVRPSAASSPNNSSGTSAARYPTSSVTSAALRAPTKTAVTAG